MGVEEHKKHGADLKLYCGVITVSDTRGHLNDISGNVIIESLSAAGHMPLYYKVVRDDKDAIKNEVELALAQDGLKAVVINGGSGIGPRDVTIEAVAPLLDKELPGFGELFRMLSFDEIGSAAMMSTVDRNTSSAESRPTQKHQNTSIALSMLRRCQNSFFQQD